MDIWGVKDCITGGSKDKNVKPVLKPFPDSFSTVMLPVLPCATTVQGLALLGDLKNVRPELKPN